MQKLNVVVVPMRSKCPIACRRPKPLIAPGISAMSGQTDLISSRVKTNLLSLRVSSDNHDSLLHGSGRSVSFGTLISSLTLIWE